MGVAFGLARAGCDRPHRSPVPPARVLPDNASSQSPSNASPRSRANDTDHRRTSQSANDRSTQDAVDQDSADEVDHDRTGDLHDHGAENVDDNTRVLPDNTDTAHDHAGPPPRAPVSKTGPPRRTIHRSEPFCWAADPGGDCQWRPGWVVRRHTRMSRLEMPGGTNDNPPQQALWGVDPLTGCASATYLYVALHELYRRIAEGATDRDEWAMIICVLRRSSTLESALAAEIQFAGALKQTVPRAAVTAYTHAGRFAVLTRSSEADVTAQAALAAARPPTNRPQVTVRSLPRSPQAAWRQILHKKAGVITVARHP